MIWVYFLGGLGTFIVAILGAIVALKKLGPEINHIQIDSAQNLVAMAEQNAKMSKDTADRLLEENRILDDRLTDYVEKLGQALARIEELERRSKNMELLQAQVNELQRDKTAVEQENLVLRERVDHLEDELSRLRSGDPILPDSD